MVYDFVLYLYLTIILVSMIGFLLFAWWWIKVKKATVVYAYMTLLFLAEVITQSGNVHARFLMHLDFDAAVRLLQLPIWTFRLVPLLLIQIFIILHVSRRIYRSKKKVINVPKKQSIDDIQEEILIVEDNKEVRKILLDHLKREFHKIIFHEAERVRDALIILNNNPNINLIITDMKLIKRTGFDLCRKVKEERPWIIVIGITGYQNDFELWAARNIGFDDFFIKPFRIGDLLDSVRKELEKLQRWKITRTKKPDVYNKRRKEDQDKLVGDRHKNGKTRT